MSTTFASLLYHLRRVSARPCTHTDADLLDRFARLHDEEAFAALVARHGLMVLNACRRILRDPHAAEDAFQATFLVLARRAGSVRRPEALAGWLYGVASRVSGEARRRQACRFPPAPATAPEPPDPRPDPLAEVTARDLLVVLEEEVRGLPGSYRLPVVLCCLEGLSQEEAAHRLGCTPGSVKGRLERGRARLHARLAKRGFTLSAALAAVEASRSPARAVPEALAGPAVRAALAWKTGTPGVAVEVASLAEAGGGLATTKLKIVLALTLLAGVGAGALAHRGARVEAPSLDPEGGPSPASEAAAPPQERLSSPPQGAGPPVGLTGHSGGVSAVAFSPDGKTLASYGLDGTLRVWDTATGAERSSFRLAKVSRSAFSPDGKLLAGSSFERGEWTWTVRVWEAATGKERTTLKSAPFSVNALSFSPDGRKLAVGGSHVKDDRGEEEVADLTLWDVATGKRAASFKPDLSRVTALAFAPDSKSLAAGSNEGDVELWDLASGRRRTIQRNEGTVVHVRALRFSPDGRSLACSLDDEVRVWDTARSKERLTFPGFSHSLAFSADGRLLAVAGGVQVRLYNLPSGKERASFEASASVNTMALSPAGTILAVGGPDGAVKLWAIPSGKGK